jgi:hypothetical protein
MNEIDILNALNGEVQTPLHWTKHEQNMAIDLAIAALEAQQDDKWVPCEERLPELEYIKNIWVTARKKGYDHRIVMRIRWDYRRFQHPNGKEISDTWEILAWKLTEYPEPYDPLADKLQKILDRESDRIARKK